MGFGWMVGRILHDRWIGVLLALSGVGFGVGGVPFDFGDEAALVSKAHFVAICLGFAAWLFGLARMTQRPSLGRPVHRSANIAAILVVLLIIGQAAQLWSMPITHRLVLLVVFGWVTVTSISLLGDTRDRLRDAGTM